MGRCGCGGLGRWGRWWRGHPVRGSDAHCRPLLGAGIALLPHGGQPLGQHPALVLSRCRRHGRCLATGRSDPQQTVHKELRLELCCTKKGVREKRGVDMKGLQKRTTGVFVPPSQPSRSIHCRTRTSRRSSIPSPTPISFTGSCRSRLTATTLPPRALPSSLVKINPVKPISRFHTRAESRAIRPWAASNTKSVSCGTSKFGMGWPVASSVATDKRFWMTRFILANSMVNASLLLNRPDVSTNNTSLRSWTARSRARYNTAAGVVARSSGPTISTPARNAHCSSCSTAPARNVSHAANNTV